MDSEERGYDPSVGEQIGLAVRARRRVQGESQRAFAARTGVSKSTVARLESSPGRMRLDDIVDALTEAGFALLVVEAATATATAATAATEAVGSVPETAETAETAETGQDPETATPTAVSGGLPGAPGWRTPEWAATDLVARTRGGSRFPAHLEVHRCEWGPGWWWLDEMLRPRRPFGPQPEWTTEGSNRKDKWSGLPGGTFRYGQPRKPRPLPGEATHDTDHTAPGPATGPEADPEADLEPGS